jgi:hypothetical protein
MYPLVVVECIRSIVTPKRGVPVMGLKRWLGIKCDGLAMHSRHQVCSWCPTRAPHPCPRTALVKPRWYLT